MVMTYIRTPFGISGDRSAIPNDVQPDGSESYTEGYGIPYQLDPDTDPDALNIPRDKFNELMYVTQVAVQQGQQDGFPEHITASMNGGTPYAYRINATVRATNGNNYYSLINGNTDVPPSSNWGLVVYAASFVTGDVLPWMFNTIRGGGWIWLNGTTIGSAASGATGRANADTQALYTLFWTDYTNEVLPIQDSAGVATTRGLSAAADFAANKRLPVPDYRGRTMFGRDTMGGVTAANRITTAGCNIDGAVLGAFGGAQNVQLTGSQNGQHLHSATTGSAGNHFHTGTTDSAGSHQHNVGTSTIVPSVGAGSERVPGYYIGGFVQPPAFATDSAGTHQHGFTTGEAGAHTHTVSVSNSGAGDPHQNMPPAIIGGGYIMKL